MQVQYTFTLTFTFLAFIKKIKICGSTEIQRPHQMSWSSPLLLFTLAKKSLLMPWMNPEELQRTVYTQLDQNQHCSVRSPGQSDGELSRTQSHTDNYFTVTNAPVFLSLFYPDNQIYNLKLKRPPMASEHVIKVSKNKSKNP